MAPDSNSSQQEDGGVLYHLSLDDSAASTILFLHGGTSSHLEWTHTAAHLQQLSGQCRYHLLLPDLPGHSRSHALRPLTLSASVLQLASLVRMHAHDSVCHVVGFSLGGYIALAFAARHPDLVASVLVSGVYDMGRSRWARLVKLAPYINAPLGALQGILPETMFAWGSKKITGIEVPEGLREDVRRNSSVRLIKEGFAAIQELGAGETLGMRSCVIAAERHDDVPGVRKLAEVLGGTESRSSAYVVRGMAHAWLLQMPEVFAQAVAAWIEKRELPRELEKMV